MLNKYFWQIADKYEKLVGNEIIIPAESTLPAMAEVVQANNGDYNESVADINLLFKGKQPQDYKELTRDLCEIYTQQQHKQGE